MNRIFSGRRATGAHRQARYYRRAQASIQAAAIRLRETRRLKPGDFPEGAQALFARDVEDLLQAARRYVRRGRKALV
ncbi:MAG: hypothetical protein HY291_20115 [Planctomycetes bacterium]|nr:hypothetical protein [Planctomycetota bacterium]